MYIKINAIKSIGNNIFIIFANVGGDFIFLLVVVFSGLAGLSNFLSCDVLSGDVFTLDLLGSLLRVANGLFEL